MLAAASVPVAAAGVPAAAFVEIGQPQPCMRERATSLNRGTWHSANTHAHILHADMFLYVYACRG